MAKAADPKLLAILEEYGETPREAMWDCHGTWVIYHRAIERIAARAKISFDMPEIVEAKSAEKIAVIVARGFMGDRSEWSFGEAAPNNNKNSYPYAMAEKRAKDRVVLKLVGLHGMAYSEEESDDFRGSTTNAAEQPAQRRSSASLKREDIWPEFEAELLECASVAVLTKLALAWSAKAEADKWPPAWRESAKEEINKRREVLINGLPDDDVFPGDRPSTKGNAYADNFIP